MWCETLYLTIHEPAPRNGGLRVAALFEQADRGCEIMLPYGRMQRCGGGILSDGEFSAWSGRLTGASPTKELSALGGSGESGTITGEDGNAFATK